MKNANPKIDAYLAKTEAWQKEIKLLRALALGCGLTEELKWNKPCYSLEGANIVIIIPLKEACALMFCKGALLKDVKKILDKPGKNTQAGRWLKFTAAAEIARLKTTVKSYIQEAIVAEKAGLEVKYKKTSDYPVPDELKSRFKAQPAFKAAFEKLTPGRQRGYLLHFSGAKQSATRAARIEKCAPQIFKGKGWNE